MQPFRRTKLLQVARPSLPLAETVPSITSEWPPIYLVPAWIDEIDAVVERAEIERRRPGIVHQHAARPCACAASAMAGMSCISKLSEPGDSVNTTRVFGRISAAMPPPISGS